MTYKDLIDMPVLQKAFTLLLKIYEVTKIYLTEERLSDILNVDYQHLVFTIPYSLATEEHYPC